MSWFWLRLRCFFNWHRLKKDERPINGVWWAFCEDCGARYGGEYDMATGETQWNAREEQWPSDQA